MQISPFEHLACLNIQFSQVSEVLESAGLEVTNFVRVEVGRSGA